HRAPRREEFLMTSVWGIHQVRPGLDFAAGDTIWLERPGVGDLLRVGDDRDRLKRALAASYPATADGTINQWAGTLIRFAFTAHAGDLVVHPNRDRRTLSIGRLVSGYFWSDAEPVDQHCRKVSWLRTGIARSQFSADAQAAVGARHAFFSV